MTHAPFDRTKHFSELASPLVTNRGVRTPQQRKAEAMENLSGAFTTDAGTITTAATTTAKHFKDAAGMRTTVFTLTSFALGNGADNAALGIGAKFFDFPAGNIWFQDAAINGTFGTSVLYTNALDAGIGSVIASGAVSVLGGTATFEDFIGSLTTAVLPTATVAGVTGTTAAAGIGSRLIASASAHTVHLNAAGTWTDIAAAGPVTFTGTIVLRWKLLA